MCIYAYCICAYILVGCLQMGLGKTLVAISVMSAFAKCRGYKSVVVCPSSLVDNWVKEIKKWLRVTSDNILYIQQGSDARAVINTFAISSVNKYPTLVISYEVSQPIGGMTDHCNTLFACLLLVENFLY